MGLKNRVSGDLLTYTHWHNFIRVRPARSTTAFTPPLVRVYLCPEYELPLKWSTLVPQAWESLQGLRKLITMCPRLHISEWQDLWGGLRRWQFHILPERHGTSICQTEEPIRSLDKSSDWRTWGIWPWSVERLPVSVKLRGTTEGAEEMLSKQQEQTGGKKQEPQISSAAFSRTVSFPSKPSLTSNRCPGIHVWAALVFRFS